MYIIAPSLTADPVKSDNVLAADQCKKIIGIAENEIGMDVGYIGEHQFDDTIRTSKVAFIPPTDQYIWIYDKITPIIKGINEKMFGYDLIGLNGLQVAKYDSLESGFYGSHKDTKPVGGLVRKLSFTIQLSDEETYDGGDLLIYNSLTSSMKMQRKLGSLTLFPSYETHEVTAVTKGVRYSLVGWMIGPSFK
jgi:PKHD-type hydroxylase